MIGSGLLLLISPFKPINANQLNETTVFTFTSVNLTHNNDEKMENAQLRLLLRKLFFSS